MWSREVFVFFNDTATTEIYTLSLHDALPISDDPYLAKELERYFPEAMLERFPDAVAGHRDRKSTRLNSSHANISYAVFCLKKKNYNIYTPFSSTYPSQFRPLLTYRSVSVCIP